MLLGDQVYADELTTATTSLAAPAPRRGEEAAPDDQVADFEEYTRLYAESWSDPQVRWLLSTIPSSMIFDDHEMIDDWNTSAAWRREITAQPTGGADRISGGLVSYWVYQHLGNLSPQELAENTTWQAMQGARDDDRRRRADAAGDGRGRRRASRPASAGATCGTGATPG